MGERESDFVWDPEKERLNILKHGVNFREAERAFEDPQRKINVDSGHSRGEPRFFCYGRVGRGILTVRFTYRDGKIRIIGAGFWRKGRERYEEEKK
ncbi:MAG: BrnT family toxin [Candidatus Omnitrophota bacterium]